MHTGATTHRVWAGLSLYSKEEKITARLTKWDFSISILLENKFSVLKGSGHYW